MQIEQLFDFLHRSVSPFHAVHTAAQLLDAAGYTRLEEAEYWNLEPEHGYYVTRNESSIIAWRVPAHAIGGWRIAASHSDSPTWRIKNTNVNAAGCIKLNVEGYGGMIMSTWGLKAWPLFSVRSMWMASDGMTSRSRSRSTRRLSSVPAASSRTSTRPAAESGRSSQVDIIIPP